MSRVNELFEAAKSAREKSYSPYSKFAVGAALIDEQGRIHTGCNIENAAYPEGCCAEAIAIGHLVMAGGKRVREALVVADADLATPCGGCRQKLLEFGDANVRVHVADLNGVRRDFTIGSLLPAGFILKEND
ncbi:MAG: cytidine deaminase [Stappiaceae bacterium]